MNPLDELKIYRDINAEDHTAEEVVDILRERIFNTECDKRFNNWKFATNKAGGMICCKSEGNEDWVPFLLKNSGVWTYADISVVFNAFKGQEWREIPLRISAIIGCNDCPVVKWEGEGIDAKRICNHPANQGEEIGTLDVFGTNCPIKKTEVQK